MTPTRLFGGRPVTTEERQLALRIATIFAIPMALIMTIPLVAAVLVARQEVQTRLNADKALVEKFNRERIERTEAINEFVFEQCVNAEIRDVVTVEQYRADILLARAYFPKGRLLNTWIETRRDGIAALEPPDEPDCTPPPAVRPEGTP